MLIFFSFIFAPTSYSSDLTRNGTFIGGGFQVLEPRGNGEMLSSDGTYYEFDFPWYNSYGLVGLTDPGPTGLGWQSKQLLGLRLTAGHRFSQKLLVRSNFSWFVPNSERTYFANLSNPETNYIDEQETKWYQWNARIQLDYYPVDPIPDWFFTIGYEYSWFSTHLDFDVVQVSDGSATGTISENYKSIHDSKGFCIGTGWTFANGTEKYREVKTSVVYTSNIYKGSYFIRDGEFNVGGISIEVDFLFYLKPKKY